MSPKDDLCSLNSTAADELTFDLSDFGGSSEPDLVRSGTCRPSLAGVEAGRGVANAL